MLTKTQNVKESKIMIVDLREHALHGNICHKRLKILSMCIVCTCTQSTFHVTLYCDLQEFLYDLVNMTITYDK